jgi:hypothetical protein
LGKDTQNILHGISPSAKYAQWLVRSLLKIGHPPQLPVKMKFQRPLLRPLFLPLVLSLAACPFLSAQTLASWNPTLDEPSTATETASEVESAIIELVQTSPDNPELVTPATTYNTCLRLDPSTGDGLGSVRTTVTAAPGHKISPTGFTIDLTLPTTAYKEADMRQGTAAPEVSMATVLLGLCAFSVAGHRRRA